MSNTGCPGPAIYVDYQTRKRLSKGLVRRYRQVIASNGDSLLHRGVMPVAQVTPV